MAFAGWLAKFGDYELPNAFLTRYVSTPNQRIELSAERDGNVYLHRETSPNYKSVVKLDIIPMNENQKILFKSIVDSGMINVRERKVNLTYWNTETHTYDNAEFYIPDIEYAIDHIDSDGIPHYEAFTVEMVQY